MKLMTKPARPKATATGIQVGMAERYHEDRVPWRGGSLHHSSTT